MGTQADIVRLVEQARGGDQSSQERLAAMATERLRLYVYRLTLHRELTEEIVQETMLEMCRVLGKLKKPDRFWPWLYGIALNMLRHHRRSQQNKASAMGRVQSTQTVQQRQEGLEALVSRELQQIVAKAMQKLKTRHRAVLIMRCYDGMSYAEIAESMGCSEFGCRMLFLRAKKALQKELSRNGFTKGSLLTALVIYGKMTAPSEAAAANVSVAAAATKVGVLASLAGWVTSKTTLLSLSVAGAAVLGMVAVDLAHRPGLERTVPANPGPSPLVRPSGSAGTDLGEYWYYFPEGVGGPMMLRVKSGAASAAGHSQILQNAVANYRYEDKTILITNYRMYMPDLRVLRLPTDRPQLVNFLSRIEGYTEKMQYVSNRGRGLLVIASPDVQRGGSRSWVTRHYNVLDEEYFQSDWPEGMNTQDRRDRMHRRGWTYFRVEGRLGSEAVVGSGQLPLVYAAWRKHQPWMILRIGRRCKIIDTPSGAVLQRYNGDIVGRYRAGAFFCGLARPWMGLHTIDTVRRDAAAYQLPFRTKYNGGNHVQVTVSAEETQLVYTIDLERDLVTAIELIGPEDLQGRIEFSYVDALEEMPQDLRAARSSLGRSDRMVGPAWLASITTEFGVKQ